MLNFRSTVRDCLYVNWAVAADALPRLPGGLRYETRNGPTGEIAFVSTVCFRQHNLRLAGLPLPSFGYPQWNLRAYVRDAEDAPSVYFFRMIVPAWVVPGARLVGGQPVLPGQLAYPRHYDPSSEAGSTWRVDVPRSFRVLVAADEPRPVEACFVSWELMVQFFRERTRGYVRTLTGLNRIGAQPADTPTLALRIRELENSLGSSILGTELGEPLSAFLAPSTEFVLALAKLPDLSLAPNPIPSPPA
jgi:uncharacterized protein YqjF (DUF2071 family)